MTANCDRDALLNSIMEKIELLQFVNEAYREVLVSLESATLVLDSVNEKLSETHSLSEGSESNCGMIMVHVSAVLLSAQRVVALDDRPHPTLLVTFQGASKKSKKTVELAFPSTAQSDALATMKRAIKQAIAQAGDSHRDSAGDLQKSGSAKKDRKKRVGSEKGDTAVRALFDWNVRSISNVGNE